MVSGFGFASGVFLEYGLGSSKDLTNSCKILFPFSPRLFPSIDILLHILFVLFLDITERLASLLLPL